MDTNTQLPLPKLSEVEKVERERKIPQPRVSRFRAIKKFELLHRPFDLRFRGRINKWLKHTTEVRELDLGKILDRDQLKIVNLYFYPQKTENRWLNQDQVLEKVSLNSKKKLRAALVASLVKIWTRTK